MRTAKKKKNQSMSTARVCALYSRVSGREREKERERECVCVRERERERGREGDSSTIVISHMPLKLWCLDAADAADGKNGCLDDVEKLHSTKLAFPQTSSSWSWNRSQEARMEIDISPRLWNSWRDVKVPTPGQYFWVHEWGNDSSEEIILVRVWI